MRILLDSQVFLWWACSPERLSSEVLALCSDERNTLILSLASVWEMQVKIQTGKLRLSVALSKLIEMQQNTNGLQLLTIKIVHLWGLNDLPLHHSDPFDRVLIAQARTENLSLVTADENIALYVVPLIRAL